MADKGVVGVLIQGTAYFLMAESANGRHMIDLGVPVALSTDCNPGSSPTVSLPLIMNLACLKIGLTPGEVITAATINFSSCYWACQPNRQFRGREKRGCYDI